ncbi:MAG: alkaline phosphatase PhoX [Myxococcota bacterium]
MELSRRQLLWNSAWVGVGFAALQACLGQSEGPPPDDPELVADPAGLLDLPPGFHHEVLSRTGDRMSDGLRVPGRPDGMGTFSGPGSRVLLVRNHELDLGDPEQSAFAGHASPLGDLDATQLYDAGHGTTPGPGGTTTLVYDPTAQRAELQFLSLAGTYRNCAGGVMPWGSWISCEETVTRAGGARERDHGYCFEVPASARPGLVPPVPLREMGRFNHEAVAASRRGDVLYLTEDRPDGLLYRFLPEVPGQLLRGGRLQALKLIDQAQADTRNWTKLGISPGERVAVTWVDLEHVDRPDDDLRYVGFGDGGAAVFARGEGLWPGHDEIYFSCTSGGAARMGQIWRYRPSPLEGRDGERSRPPSLELLVEVVDRAKLKSPDNLTVAPWGDLLVCEDGGGDNRLLRIDPAGRLHLFARNVFNDSELAGVCFSPEGRTLFVNIQDPGLTLAIQGPWPRASRPGLLERVLRGI